MNVELYQCVDYGPSGTMTRAIHLTTKHVPTIISALMMMMMMYDIS